MVLAASVWSGAQESADPSGRENVFSSSVSGAVDGAYTSVSSVAANDNYQQPELKPDTYVPETLKDAGSVMTSDSKFPEIKPGEKNEPNPGDFSALAQESAVSGRNIQDEKKEANVETATSPETEQPKIIGEPDSAGTVLSSSDNGGEKKKKTFKPTKRSTKAADSSIHTEEELAKSLFAQKESRLKIGVDNVNYVDPDYNKKEIETAVEGTDEAKKANKAKLHQLSPNVFVEKDQMLPVTVDNVDYVKPDVGPNDSMVVRSQYDKSYRPVVVKDSLDAPLGVPYKGASYTTEESAKDTVKFQTLGTPYSIKTRKLKEAISGGY